MMTDHGIMVSNKMNAAPESWKLSEAADGHLVLPKEPLMPNHSASSTPRNNEPPKRTKQVKRAAELRDQGLKFCPGCETALPFSAFNRNTTRYDGVRSECKQCARNSRTRYRVRELAHAPSPGQCWYCGVGLTSFTATQDHVIPKSKGGADAPENIVACCQSCNSSKRDRPLEQFREYRRRQRDKVPYFNKKQRAFLENHEIEIPDGEPYFFWFEKEEAA